MVDVQRVEVINGPQSTLYGKNSSAGVVALYTKPPAEQLDARVEVSGGALDTRGSPTLINSKLSLSGPLTDMLSGGLAASYSRHGHTFANALPGGPDGNDDNRLAVRAQLLWARSEQLELRLIAGVRAGKERRGRIRRVLRARNRVSSVAHSCAMQGGPRHAATMFRTIAASVQWQRTRSISKRSASR